MKKFSRLAVIIFLWTGVAARAEVPGAPAAVAKPKAAPSPYAALESFVGGRWVAALPADKDGNAMRIELRFAWAENRQGVRFDSAFVSGEKRAPYTSGLYGWDGAKGKLVIFYMDSSGSLTEGPVTQEGDVLVHELTVTDKAGKLELVRVRLTKVSADVFTNDIFVQKDGAWAKVVAVRYERQG